MNRRRPVWAAGLLLAATAAGAALRLVAPDWVPPALHQDEAVNGYDAYSLWLTGRDHHGRPPTLIGLEAFGDWVSPLLTFLTVPAVGAFGLRVEVLRAVSASVGVLAIPLTYVLALELFGRRSAAVLAAWLLALSPWHVLLSRWAIPPAIVPTMLALTLWLWLRAMRTRRGRDLLAVSVAAALTVASYPSMKVYLPLLGGAALLIYWRPLTRLRRRDALVALGIWLALVGPVLWSQLFDPAVRARANQVSVLRRAPGDLTRVARQYSAYFSPRFLFQRGDGDPMHAPAGFGVEPLTLAPAYALGLLGLVGLAARGPTEPNRRGALLVICALLLYPIPGCLTVPAPDAFRGAHLIPLAALIGAVGLAGLGAAARRVLARAPGRAARASFALLLLAASLSLGQELWRRHATYLGDYRLIVASEFHYGLAEALRYTFEHQARYDEIWVLDSNEPYIHLLFESRWPPGDVQERLLVERAPPAFNRAIAIDKYRFEPPSDASVEQLPLLRAICYPDGNSAYDLREGWTSAGGRLLVVFGRPVGGPVPTGCQGTAGR